MRNHSLIGKNITALLILAVGMGLPCGGCRGVKGGVDRSIDAGPEALAEGYTLYSRVLETAPATLVDMEGRVVHRWHINGFPAEMLPGGALLGNEGRYRNTQGCRTLALEAWNGDRTWSFSRWYQAGDTWYARQHHGFQVSGNPVGYYAPSHPPAFGGTVLVLAHAPRLVPEINPAELRDDVIYEVDASGLLTGFIWYASDHVDALGFSEAARKTLWSFEAEKNGFEWLHGNSIARVGTNRFYDAGDSRFHPDNIIYSSRRANIIAIIDYRNGEIVWRIGPDFAGQPEAALGQFVGQHFPHIIPAGLPGEGNMLVFDNGGQSGYEAHGDGVDDFIFERGYSRVVELDPVSLEIVWQYGAKSGEAHFFSKLMGSAQRLPNGNTLIAVGETGEILEVTVEKRVVWRYVAPSETDNNAIYRAYRVPPEWLPDGADTGAYAPWGP